ncbi:MAG: DUF1573 domain-containing protein [Pirellulaceae bacterium]|nr:DUF1573 domain-containing protein [Pirellulaceae bacterium]
MAWSLLAPAVWGQEWAKEMFEKTTHNFGVVARGAKVEHRFVLENIYVEDVQIRSVSSTCGCAKIEVTKKLLKTWEKSEIVVQVDTRGFLGRKDSTITVVFDQPFYAEVQLHVHSYIRSDVVIQPWAAEFGTVAQGAGASQTLRVTYAGRSDWQIERVESTNPNVEFQIEEAYRGGGQVSYNLTVRLLKTAPPGYIRDHLILVTNDRNTASTRVPIAVEGVVTSPLSARPSPLLLGLAEPGCSTTRNLVVQGQAPFRITSATSTDSRFCCQIGGEAKQIHIVPVTFRAEKADAQGMVETTIKIETDLTGESTLEVRSSVQIVSPKT